MENKNQLCCYCCEPAKHIISIKKGIRFCCDKHLTFILKLRESWRKKKQKQYSLEEGFKETPSLKPSFKQGVDTK